MAQTIYFIYFPNEKKFLYISNDKNDENEYLQGTG